jgi:hypothetical protein
LIDHNISVRQINSRFFIVAHIVNVFTNFALPSVSARFKPFEIFTCTSQLRKRNVKKFGIIYRAIVTKAAEVIEMYFIRGEK